MVIFVTFMHTMNSAQPYNRLEKGSHQCVQNKYAALTLGIQHGLARKKLNKNMYPLCYSVKIGGFV